MPKIARKSRISVIPSSDGNIVDLGSGSYSNLILTKDTLKKKRKKAGNKNMLGYSVFKPGIDTAQKIHVRAEELAYVLSGNGKLRVGDELVEFKTGDSIHIPPGVPHGIKNDSKEEVAMVFVFSSPNYPKTKNA